MKSTASLLRALATALLALGIVAAGFELGSPEGAPVARADEPLAPYYAEDEMPAYPNAFEFPMGSDLAFNGVPLRISHFTTTDIPEKVRDHYVQAFEKLDAPIRVYPTEDGGFTVTAIVAGGASQAVVAITRQGKQTEVFPSIVPLGGELQDPGKVAEEDIPFSESAVGLARMSEAQGEFVTYHEPLLKVRDAADHIRQHLGSRGWSVGSASETAHGLSLVASRGAQRAMVQIAPYQKRPTGAMVAVQYGAKEE